MPPKSLLFAPDPDNEEARNPRLHRSTTFYGHNRFAFRGNKRCTSSSDSLSEDSSIKNHILHETVLEEEQDSFKAPALIEVKNISSTHIAVTQRTQDPHKFQAGKVIEPDTSIVKRAYSYDTSLVDGMHFRDD